MPSVNPGESQKDYISRCIPIVMHEHEGMKNDQAAAICYSLFRKHNEKPKNEGILNRIRKILDL